FTSWQAARQRLSALCRSRRPAGGRRLRRIGAEPGDCARQRRPKREVVLSGKWARRGGPAGRLYRSEPYRSLESRPSDADTTGSTFTRKPVRIHARWLGAKRGANSPSLISRVTAKRLNAVAGKKRRALSGKPSDAVSMSPSTA